MSILNCSTIRRIKDHLWRAIPHDVRGILAVRLPADEQSLDQCSTHDIIHDTCVQQSFRCQRKSADFFIFGQLLQGSYGKERDCIGHPRVTVSNDRTETSDCVPFSTRTRGLADLGSDWICTFFVWHQ
ncbi:hypothetical protein AVEN_9397-1 [Araneus ventricosus]|uniref:Uncharacterized protein n=1 Tax=Araneus ventricosus TaxID=182803 RepID=A0A4Y2DJ54_ARAVE|nr:hypothetical protein AVEN_9397-1 [Araneus ventricosus]